MVDDEKGADGERVRLRLAWVDFEEADVLSANQIVSQFLEEGLFVVSFGMVTPPFLTGSADERKEQAEALGFLPVRTLARIALTPLGMRAMIDTLQANLEKYEQRFQAQPLNREDLEE